MKKILFIFLTTPILALAQSQDQNYTKTTTYKVATTTPSTTSNVTEANVQVTYYDGLGRPIQQIAHQQSNSGKDIVTHIEYDQFGRQSKEFLPYANSATSQNYIDPTSATSDLYSFYSSYNGGATTPYSEKELELSPLDRVFKQAAPGNDWVMGSGHEIKFDYQTNIENEVKKFTVTSTWSSTYELFVPTLNNDGYSYYESNQLYKTITKDENWTSGKNHTTEEFKNKQGQVVLKRTYNNSQVHDTYYVYDQYNNLVYVIPPLANGAYDGTTLNELCYQYKYDNRNRLVEKKLPGKGWEFIVYNTQDLVVATGPVYSPFGDNKIGWLITKYDVFSRVIYTGFYTGRIVSSTERLAYQNEQNGLNSGWKESDLFPETYDGVNLGYSNKVAPMSNYKVLTINYYDDYDNPYAPSVIPTSLPNSTLPIVDKVKGLPTGSWVRVLDSPNNTTAEISYTLYDTKYRPVRTRTSNYLGGYTQVDTKLTWAGRTEYTVTEHKYNSNASLLIVKDVFTYTDQDRLLMHTQQINNGFKKLIAKNTYDELGQLISKNVGGNDYSTGNTGLQKVDYAYNIRGWLKEINNVNNLTAENDLFAFKISYNEPENATALYNGNISETFWKSLNADVKRKYTYSYDHLNRLIEANYSKPLANIFSDNYLEKLTYDKNGNIKTLLRNGNLDSDGSSPTQEIDRLVYTYSSAASNKLIKVSDSATNSPQGFKDGTNTGNDYGYDNNGNMVFDNNKGITQIIYNHLNLPFKITFGTKGNITYLYNALGQKIQKKVVVNTPNSTTFTNYMQGGFQYKDNSLEFFPHAEGYVNVTLNTSSAPVFHYVFNYTDHLGNVRISYSDANNNNKIELNEILEESNYYPFGLKHTGYNTTQRQYVFNQTSQTVVLSSLNHVAGDGSYQYKYNGKEYQDELNLNLYDYGWRNYDPAMARWLSTDPLAEKFPDQSPYSFVFNNPLRFIDPDGRAPFDWIKNNKTGAFVWDNNVTSASNTPKGFSYVGKNDSSIVSNLFNSSSSRVSDWDAGLISTEDFDNPYSAKGAAFMNMSANTTMSVNLSADVSTVYNSDGSIQSKDFKGINISTSISGEVVAPYPGVDISLVSNNMTLQGNEMKVHQTSPYGEIRQGGDVPTLTFDSYWNSSSIQNNFGKSIDLNFSFKGQYLNGNTPMSFIGAAGLLGLPNTTNLSTSINFNNTAPATKIDPNKL